MNYKEAVAYLESFPPMKEKPGLERIKLFFEESGDPQNSIDTIHVGGTNGKGSTALTVDALIRALGLKTGRFTGPHMFTWRERIAINGETISEADFGRLAGEIKILSEKFGAKHPELGVLSWFEVLTVMAFFKFKEENIDVAVMEVGLGGRFDATNAADRVIGTIITNIDLEHTHILGDTVEKIAFEKAGIMKAGVKVTTGARGDALEELHRQAALKNTELVEASETLTSDSPFIIRKAEILADLALVGPHQRTNSLLALTMLAQAKRFQGPGFSDDAAIERMRKALASLIWPGRFQLVEDKQLILDVAHNPASAKVLRRALDQFSSGNYLFVVGFFRSKDVPGFLENLLRKGDRVIACNLNTRRKFYSAREIKAICQDLSIECSTARDVILGMRQAARLHAPGQYTVATGSFEVVRSTMRYLGWHPDVVARTFKTTPVIDPRVVKS